MKTGIRFLRPASASLVALIGTGTQAQIAPDDPKLCSSCEQWNQPQEPFRIFGNTYYVGTTELSAVLVHSNDGLILLDAALPQSAPLIDDNIRALGFDTADIRLILTSHAHFDHVGGIAAFQRATGAPVAASPKSAAALRIGDTTPDDPQYAFGDMDFPPIEVIREISDGETLTVGDVQISAHFTPGHTPGGTSWTWRACETNSCLNVVYADSLSPASAEGFRFTGDATSPSIVDEFSRSIRRIEEMSCDILLAPHSGLFGMSAKLQRLEDGDSNAFVDSSACERYASIFIERLSRRIEIESEQATQPI